MLYPFFCCCSQQDLDPHDTFAPTFCKGSLTSVHSTYEMLQFEVSSIHFNNVRASPPADNVMTDTDSYPGRTKQEKQCMVGVMSSSAFSTVDSNLSEFTSSTPQQECDQPQPCTSRHSSFDADEMPMSVQIQLENTLVQTPTADSIGTGYICETFIYKSNESGPQEYIRGDTEYQVAKLFDDTDNLTEWDLQDEASIHYESVESPEKEDKAKPKIKYVNMEENVMNVDFDMSSSH